MPVVEFSRLPNCASRIRRAFERTQHGRQEWIEGTVDLAQALSDARAEHESDRAFGHWLVDNELDDISKDDRAALLGMAGNIDLARAVLLETTRLSWRMIWIEEMADRFRSAAKPEPPPAFPETCAEPTPTPPEQQPSDSDSAESDQDIADHPPKPAAKNIDRRHSFYGLERGGEVASYYLSEAMRPRIAAAARNKKTGKKIWSLILKAIDEGLLTPNKVDSKQVNLGILFPRAPINFRQSRVLTKPAELDDVAERILPAALANKARIIAKPEHIEEIISAFERERVREVQATRYAERVEEAKSAMHVDEQEVIMFGHRYWPIVDLKHPDLAYNYDEMRSAVWTFYECYRVMQTTNDRSPASCGARIRHMLKFLSGIADRKAMALIWDLTRKLQAKPEGEIRLPPMPNMDRPFE